MKKGKLIIISIFFLVSIGGLLAFQVNSENVARTTTGQVHYRSTTTVDWVIINCCYPNQTQIDCGHTTLANEYEYWNGTNWVPVPAGTVLKKCIAN
jgi:hypothetical protein